ncbi:phospho-sugar mutase [Asanoa sp. WMMD1127]|uniref:phospho-sugar mutase n=1 Tax=Asanoa sp. WMMD1127 TaxID=3016107 RepID=UPI0024166379|nr:phospho-sugar mutase [Asanoa sp. WMMD1127]MDG4822801.1 phospho-sugar mutase [Asanoa sp. WMMD1127]
MTELDDLAARARAWLADDPDDASRAELARVLDGLPGTAADLADRFAGPLTFGTAGLRGPLRAGPNGMNLAVVTQAAAGLVNWLGARGASGPLVIGYDARHGSRAFAERTAQVATGAGREAMLLPRPLPTPVLAYAVRKLGAAAGVMVTASHNPPQDNGYKVYLGAELGGVLGAGAQIVPPADAEISAAIAAVGRLSTVPLGDLGVVLDDDIVESYVENAARVVDPDGPRDLAVAYTPLHGVGAPVLAAAFARAGFARPHEVAEQAEPDPMFPTVAFPNPEEPGAIDRVVELATVTGADIAIANDPDADRCAVAIPGPLGWRMLRGDEVGVLLADHLQRRGVAGRYATTIVSSSLLSELCARRGVPYGATLTGFKWIVRAGEDLAYGYEEALGYCVAPELVRDKDGITAALLVAEMAAGLKASLRTIGDRLDELAAEFGVYATDQLSVRVDALPEIETAMTYIRTKTPGSLLDDPVIAVEDMAPENDVLILRTESARVVVRPSGTEPKLKAYLEVVEPVVDGDVGAARERAAASVRALRTETAAALGIW